MTDRFDLPPSFLPLAGVRTLRRFLVPIACAAGVTGIVVLTDANPLLGIPPAAIALTVYAILVLTPTVVEVGNDGVTIAWLRRHRFIPHARIRQVVTVPRALLPGDARLDLVLDDGEVVALVTCRHYITDDGELAARMARAIDDARQTSNTADAPPAPLLERGGDEPARDFVERLRCLGRDSVAGSSSFRSPSMPFDELERRLFDPRADCRERAASAIVLAASSDGIDPKRLRDVIERTANPSLRIVLQESAADGERLTAALDRMNSRGA